MRSDFEKRKGHEREAATPGKFPGVTGNALDKVAATVGWSRKTYTKAQAVVEAAEQEPDTFGDLEEVVRGEFAENAIRKDFTPSEAVAIGRALESLERDAARERQEASRANRGENFTPRSMPEQGETLDRVASAVGMSRGSGP